MRKQDLERYYQAQGNYDFLMGSLCALDQKTLLRLAEILHLREDEFDSVDILIKKCKAKLRQPLGLEFDFLRWERGADFVKEALRAAKQKRRAEKEKVVAVNEL